MRLPADRGVRAAIADQPWLLLIDGAAPGWRNMAVDSALLDAAEADGTVALRLYGWAPHCLSFGRHEPAAALYSRNQLNALGIDCVRRPTGGRSVWHARELTYAIAGPIERLGGLRVTYERIHRILQSALAGLGIEAALAPRPARQEGPAGGLPCFSAAAGGEVMVDGLKVAGSAQLRQGSAVLQHGSLLLEDDQSLLHSLRNSAPAGPAGEAPLARFLHAPVSFEQAAAAVAAAAEGALGPARRIPRLPPDIAARADRHGERFQSAAWTWRS